MMNELYLLLDFEPKIELFYCIIWLLEGTQ